MILNGQNNTIWKPYASDLETIRITPSFQNNLLQCHHVGSTSVPGLAAKPKIDIIAEVKDARFDHTPLEALGYRYQGSFNLPSRQSFTYRSPTINVNLHVFPADDPEIKLNLVFRNTLRNNDALRDAYAELKYKILKSKTAHETQGMYRGYTLLKQDFIHQVLRDAGFTDLRCVFPGHPNEWASVHRFWKQERQTDTPPPLRPAITGTLSFIREPSSSVMPTCKYKASLSSFRNSS